VSKTLWVHPGSLCLGGKRIELQAVGRLMGEFAPQKRRNHFGRASVPIIWRAVVCAVRDARWEWGGGEAQEIPQTIAKT
jgi:hypothetical protein